MQTEDGRKRTGKWKVVAGVGTAAALGFAGIAWAGGGDIPAEPAPIALQGQVVPAAASSAGTTSRDTSTTGGSSSASPSATPRATHAAGHDDIDCANDDCSSDSHNGAPNDSCASIDSVDCSIDS